MESAKECVTTHEPNESALKMDGASTGYRYSTVGLNAMDRRVGRRGGTAEAFGVSQSEGASSADLGCSSNYTIETHCGRKWEKVPQEKHFAAG